MTQKMTPSEKARRSATLRVVTNLAPSVGIEVINQFTKGGRALVGKRGEKRVVWLEETGQWHEVSEAPSLSGFVD